MKTQDALHETDAYCALRQKQIRSAQSVALREGAVYYVSADDDDEATSAINEAAEPEPLSFAGLEGGTKETSV